MGLWGFVIAIGALVGLIAGGLLVLIYYATRSGESGAAGKSAKNIPDASTLGAELAEVLPQYVLLDEGQQQRLVTQAGKFLRKLRISGHDGQEVTPIMTHCIAANACLLCLHPDGRPYPKLKRVVVVPKGAEKAPEPGSSTVVLDWDEVLATTEARSRNPVLHAFAERLLDTNKDNQFAPDWQAEHKDAPMIMSQVMAKVQRGASEMFRKDQVADRRAMFLSGTEIYFCRGWALNQQHPALFNLLREYYEVDTSSQGQPAA